MSAALLRTELEDDVAHSSHSAPDTAGSTTAKSCERSARSLWPRNRGGGAHDDRQERLEQKLTPHDAIAALDAALDSRKRWLVANRPASGSLPLDLTPEHPQHLLHP